MMTSGWGAYPRAESRWIRGHRTAEVLPSLADGPLIARGAGRAYGDAAIGRDATLFIGGLDRLIDFDPETGLLTVEAGVTLYAVIRAFLPRGFFPPVVPGTQYVTIGGMIASHVHGKNHHLAGGFGGHVQSLVLVGPDGVTRRCSPGENAELFWATLGGMGLTGVIVEATLQLVRVETGLIRQETVVARDLDAALAGLDRSADWTYAVAWIDTLARGAALGRSLIHLGEHALAAEAGPARERPSRSRPPFPVPFDLPEFTINRLSVGAFNTAWFLAGASPPRHRLVPFETYFFPLDGLTDWSRLYGRRGFVQHQCVIPRAAGRETLAYVLDLVSRLGSPSFLAVLKLLGPDPAPLMAFPMEGYTLAMDFPASQESFALLATIDARLRAVGGRIYLAKDALQSRETLEAGYPRLAAFRDLRRRTGASKMFVSRQSERLAL
jgi:decaprenylphospho-beta-D-ribofuranose 2-oxidase